MSGKRTALPLPAPSIRPVADEWEWQHSARCRTMDSSIFFHPDNERGRARRQREQHAKQVCQQCPVKRPVRRLRPCCPLSRMAPGAEYPNPNAFLHLAFQAGPNWPPPVATSNSINSTLTNCSANTRR